MSETKAPEVAGRIMPRKSWPRRATPTDLVPAWAGEFRDYEDWVSKATNRLTGTYDPMMGNEVPAICIDAFGRRCTLGGHFRRAMEEGAFPVRFFWDCEPPSRAEESAVYPPQDIATVRDWLRELPSLDMEDIAADGGVTVAMVVQQQAREMAARLERALREISAKAAGEQE